MYLFQCTFVSRAVKLLIQLESLRRNEGFLFINTVCTLCCPVGSSCRKRFTLCCWIFKFNVSICATAGAAVPGTMWSRHPVLAPLWRERGLAGLFKSLLHRDRHFWFYPWCYVQEWRPTSDAWWCCDTIIGLLTTYQRHRRRSQAGGCCWLLLAVVSVGSDWSACQANQSSRRQASPHLLHVYSSARVHLTHAAPTPIAISMYSVLSSSLIQKQMR